MTQGCRPALSAMAAVMLAVAGCGGSGGGSNTIVAAPPDNCNAVGQNQFVLDVMQDIYFWKSELPTVDPAAFDSPEAMLEQIAFTPLDRFTFINDAAADDAFFSDSQFIGVGMGLKVDAQDALRVTQAFADGPAAAAGIARGYTILKINGDDVADILDGIGTSAAFGADEVGVQVDLEYADLAGTVFAATLFKDLVTIETVTTSRVFDVGGRRVGYLVLRNFVSPTFAALESAFADFAAEGVQDVILDVRYNGGGLISVAEFLGGLLGGAPTSGEVFADRVHNADNSFRDVRTVFQDELNSVAITRLVVIGTGATASASELVVNALAPFMDVTWVGDDTFGKPVGSYGFEFCGKVIHPISFQNFNAAGFGDYFDGFKADCPASDDLEHALGDLQEASLQEAVGYLATGACPTVASAVAKAAPADSRAKRAFRAGLTGFRQLTGAF